MEAQDTMNKMGEATQTINRIQETAKNTLSDCLIPSSSVPKQPPTQPIPTSGNIPGAVLPLPRCLGSLSGS